MLASVVMRFFFFFGVVSDADDCAEFIPEEEMLFFCRFAFLQRMALPLDVKMAERAFREQGPKAEEQIRGVER